MNFDHALSYTLTHSPSTLCVSALPNTILLVPQMTRLLTCPVFTPDHFRTEIGLGLDVLRYQTLK